MKRDFQVPTMRRLTTGLSLMAVSVSAAALDLNVNGTNARLYGYAELNMIYDVHADLGPLLVPQRVALDQDNVAEGQFQADANESRIGLATSTPMMHGGDLKIVVEGDFYNGGNMRLRQAYGEWNGLLVGQTFTNFPGFTGIYPTVDFRVPIASSTARQAQVRYTTGKLSVALEDPGNLGDSVAGSVNVANGAFVKANNAKDSLPDITIRYSTKGAISYHASAVLRELAADDGIEDDSAFGWGVSLGIANRVTDALTLRANVVYGDGIGGYINRNPGAPAYAANGKVETIVASGGTLGASLEVGPGEITLGTAIARADWDDAVKDGLAGATEANEEYRSTHLNYIWSPVKAVTLGVEAAYHEREIWSGASGDAVRLQAMARFSF
ncbi:DcaP family trimeric outer membrane transporter [Marinobacter sp.]|uniref:DcaP family trimeric outer membrane transporter n=1 Tax=Marinobacter sp. TaxID=50741 RepID=UPI003A8D5276